MTDPAITIYTTPLCPYCIGAKLLLRRRGLPFHEIDVRDPAARAALAERSGRPTVPQIYFGERHIGGFDDLREVDRRGELRALAAR